MMSEFRGREGVHEIRTFSDKGEGGGQGNSDIWISKSKFKGKLLQTLCVYSLYFCVKSTIVTYLFMTLKHFEFSMPYEFLFSVNKYKTFH